MAALGSIGRLEDSGNGRVGPINAVFGAPADYFSVHQDGTISGTLTDSGSPVAGAVVYLHFRRSGMPVGRAISKADGTFSFTGCVNGSNQYYVVALDKEGGTTYNALIFDQVTPT